MSDVQDWIRPWYPAGLVGHIYRDCEQLLEQVPEPDEGAGWLDPHKGEVCGACANRHGGLSWDAVCDTCDSSMSYEWEEEGAPLNDDDADSWKRDHRCDPSVRVVPPKSSRKKP